MEAKSIFKGAWSRRILPIMLPAAILFAGCALEPEKSRTETVPDTKSVILDKTNEGSNSEFDQKSDSRESDQKSDHDPEETVLKVVEQTGPSVVSIETDQKSGSGVIFREDGYIITNDHVIRGAEQVIVRLSDKRTVKADKVGTDPISDVAVIKIEEENLKAAVFADSDKVKTGITVLAIGNPKGIANTTTTGTISNVNVDVDTGMNIVRCLQTDASINPGNSGGALVNLKGEVVGIVDMGRIDAESMNYAIPSNNAVKVAKQLISEGYIARPYLGVEAINDMIENEPVIRVRRVMNDSPAARDGLKSGDYIIKINDVRVRTVSKLREQLNNSGADSMVSLYIIRPTKKEPQQGSIQIKLETLPKGHYPVDWS